MRVLLTNDDGIESAGLRALAEAFAVDHETVVVAPEQERSATGHAVTLHKPLRARQVTAYPRGVTAWATNGTPADCVILGVLELLTNRPDIVVSGVNVGANLGRDLTYSGTVSGAMEGAILGVPAIAVSIAAFENVIFEVAARFAVHLAGLCCGHSLPEDTLLNVNVPNVPRDRLRGVALTRQSSRRYLSSLERRTDPRGQTYYWLTGQREISSEPEGTDAWALAAGCISVTPVHLNMTDERLFDTLRAWDLRVP